MGNSNPSNWMQLGTKGAVRSEQPTRRDYQTRLAQLLCAPTHQWKDRRDRQSHIAKQVLEKSTTLDHANFRKISRQDLECMAEAYDRLFLGGLCLPLARSYGLSFRLSSRMTRAGGKTTRQVFRSLTGRPAITKYEIALSTSLLFQSFRKPGEKNRVCGILCQDRLSAMQRVVEHELIHLCEMLVWVQSDCAAGRFQGIAQSLFGHTEHRHGLVTQQERAAKDFNIPLGAKVEFSLNGHRLAGFVNRITSRATVLVPDPSGTRYNDGRNYRKYYVPIHRLRRIR